MAGSAGALATRRDRSAPPGIVRPSASGPPLWPRSSRIVAGGVATAADELRARPPAIGSRSLRQRLRERRRRCPSGVLVVRSGRLPRASRDARSLREGAVVTDEPSPRLQAGNRRRPGEAMRVASVYLLRCADDSLYCGWTTDIQRRLAAHRSGTASRYTRSRRPVELAVVISVGDRSAALREEARIKRLPRAAKLQLIEASLDGA